MLESQEEKKSNFPQPSLVVGLVVDSRNSTATAVVQWIVVVGSTGSGGGSGGGGDGNRRNIQTYIKRMDDATIVIAVVDACTIS